MLSTVCYLGYTLRYANLLNCISQFLPEEDKLPFGLLLTTAIMYAPTKRWSISFGQHSVNLPCCHIFYKSHLYPQVLRQYKIFISYSLQNDRNHYNIYSAQLTMRLVVGQRRAIGGLTAACKLLLNFPGPLWSLVTPSRHASPKVTVPLSFSTSNYYYLLCSLTSGYDSIISFAFYFLDWKLPC